MKLMFIQNNSISNVMSLDATKLTSVIGMISHKMSLITIFGHTSILEKFDISKISAAFDFGLYLEYISKFESKLH